MTTSEQPTPLSLLARLRSRSQREDWARFIEFYTPLLFAWVRGFRVPADDLEDVVQGVFLKLFTRLPQFSDGRGRFRGWLWTVTRNHIRDYSSKKPAAAALDPNVLADGDNVAEWAEDEYRQHLYQQAMRVMRRDFKETTWQACWMCVVEERSPAEVAQTLGLSEDAVYKARLRVLRRLRQELDGLLD